jgi:hypothetical protein
MKVHPVNILTLGDRYMYPLRQREAERGRDFTGLVEAVQCSCTYMAQCMRHAPLDIFTPSCLDMHGEYILTDGRRAWKALTDCYEGNAM